MKALLLLSLLMMGGCNEGMQTFAAPVESEVTEMILGSDSLGGGTPDGDEESQVIVVPKTFYGGILSRLDGATKDHDPMKWVSYADLWITSKSKVTHLQIFRTGEKSGAIKVDGKYYRTADEAALIGTIQSMIHQSSGSTPSANGN